MERTEPTGPEHEDEDAVEDTEETDPVESDTVARRSSRYGYWPTDELETAPYDSWDWPVMHTYRDRLHA